MFFNKKSEKKCQNCKSNVKKDFSYCPVCGSQVSNSKKELKNYGLLGRSDYTQGDEDFAQESKMGFTDKILNSMVNSLMKSLEKQFKDLDKEIAKDMQNPEVSAYPNGIKIRFTPGNLVNPTEKSPKNKPSINILKKHPLPDQLKTMSKLPRKTAKSKIKRLSNTVIYELSTPGLQTLEDVFLSKLEEGYEVKAIGERSVFVNSLPIDLPLKKLSLIKDKLLIEFKPN